MTGQGNGVVRSVRDRGHSDWELVDAIARRVLELIEERDPSNGPALLTVAQVAARLGVGLSGSTRISWSWGW
jgi:hypothetical protein